MKNILKKILIALCALIILVSIALVATGNGYFFRGLTKTYLQGHTTANIDDYTSFDNREIKSDEFIAWEKDERFGSVELTDKLSKTLEDSDAIAFAIIQDGKLLYENYWLGYSDTSLTNSFSMAKSMITMVFLKAVEDGYISSVNEPISKLLPEYKNVKYAKDTTLLHLSAMTAGYDWQENYYLPLNPTAKAYYGYDIAEQVVARGFDRKSGVFKYSSGQTQLLTVALDRALAKHGYTISSYFEEKFWQPLGMQNSAFWSLDGDAKLEKGFCCVSASALDFAKFGQMLFNKGVFNGKRILSEDHVNLMVTPNTAAFPKGEKVTYGHSIWTYMKAPTPFYAMLGHLGQRVIVIPEHNAVVVRLGHTKAQVETVEGHYSEPSLSVYVDEVDKILTQLSKDK